MLTFNQIIDTEPLIAFIWGVVGAIVLLILIWILSPKKKRLDFSDLKKMIEDSAKELHSAYSKLNRLYSIINKAEKKGELKG